MIHEADEVIGVNLDHLGADDLRALLRDEITRGVLQMRLVKRLLDTNELLRARLAAATSGAAPDVADV